MLVIFYRAFICFSSLRIVFLDIRPSGEPFHFPRPWTVLAALSSKFLGVWGQKKRGNCWKCQSVQLHQRGDHPAAASMELLTKASFHGDSCPNLSHFYLKQASKSSGHLFLGAVLFLSFHPVLSAAATLSFILFTSQLFASSLPWPPEATWVRNIFPLCTLTRSRWKKDRLPR